MPDENQIPLVSETPEKPPTSSPAVGIEKSGDIDAASRSAIDLFTQGAGAGKKKPGRPKKYPSADEIALGGNNSSGDKGAEGKGLLENRKTADVPFDEEMAKAMVNGVVEMMQEFSSTLISIIATHKGCDPEVTEQAIKNSKMKPNIEAMVKTGGLQCAKKYGASFAYMPEVAVIGGLSIWLTGTCMTIKKLKGVDETPKIEVVK